MTVRQAELMVRPRVVFVLAAEQDISPHKVEAVLLERIHFRCVGRIGIELMEALVRVKIEMGNECGKNEGKDPVGEKNIPFVEVVHVSGGRRVFEEDSKARSEH